MAAERQRSRLMRAGEQLRFDVHAKLSVSAPRPSSGPFGATFPQGKVWGAHHPAVRQKSTTAVCAFGLFRQCRFAQRLGFPWGPIPPIRGKCPAGTKGVGTDGCGAAAEQTDEGRGAVTF